MASYLLFAEGESQPNNLLERLGLGGICGPHDSSPTWVHVPAGPGGKSGLLGYWARFDEPQRRFDPETQDWRKIAGKECWLGLDRLSPLVPEDIARAERFPHSWPVPLEDGNQWFVATAPNLPHVWKLNDQGVVNRVPKPAFADFVGLSEEVYQELQKPIGDRRPRSMAEDWPYLCHALTLNYRLTPEIISELMLIGDATWVRMLAATVELSIVRTVEDEKKNME